MTQENQACSSSLGVGEDFAVGVCLDPVTEITADNLDVGVSVFVMNQL